MPTYETKGPFCQSCSMPLNRPEDFGTDQAGFRINDYCTHCYANGAFTDPGISMQDMLDRSVDAMDQAGVMPAPQARALLLDVLPRLKRWRAPSAAMSR